MKKYTRNNRRLKRKRRHVRKSRKQYTLKGGLGTYTENYKDDDIFLFNESLDIFGEPFSGASTHVKPIYGKYYIEEWIAKSRETRAKELKKANATPSSGNPRVKGLIEPVLEYINNKNIEALKDARKQGQLYSSSQFINFPFILSIPEFKYTILSTSTEASIPSEIVPSAVDLDIPNAAAPASAPVPAPAPPPSPEPNPILPDDFLRFTKRSSVLNILFPFFMKVYISLQKDLNEDVGSTNKTKYNENLENMKFVLKTLREIHSFASPIWFNHIYASAYNLGLNKLFKVAKDGYSNYMDKLNKALAKTNEVPIETTMYSFPSYANCYNKDCKPNMKKSIHTYLVKNGDFDDKEPIDNLLNMYFFGKDSGTTAFSQLTNEITKGPLPSLQRQP